MADSTHDQEPESSQETAASPPRRTRRRAGAPTGAPASGPSEQLASDGPAAPRTVVPEQTAAPTDPAPTARRSRRAGAPAGAPDAPEPGTAAEAAPGSGTAAPVTSVGAQSPAPEPLSAPVEDTGSEGAGPDPAQPVSAEVATPAGTDEQAPAPSADEDQSSSAVVDDLRALADARGGTAEEDEHADRARREQAQLDFASLLFQAPTSPSQPRTTVGAHDAPVGNADLAFEAGAPPVSTEDQDQGADQDADSPDRAESQDGSDDQDRSSASGGGSRRRRRRGGRGRRGRGRSDEDRGEDTSSSGSDGADAKDSGPEAGSEDSSDSGDGDNGSGSDGGSGSTSSRRRRRRRRSGSGGGENASPDDPPNTVVKVREARDEVKAVKGSTRLEAKKQRRREGRDAGRRRNVITEAEFLARRESVKRSMIIRERPGRTQIAVLEDDVLVEHYVAQKSQSSMVGNVYLGKVQNVLPSMEAAFIDVGRGRNAVLYAGEVNWDAVGLEGQPRRIELALTSGDSVLAQVTKDPIGHKGARLTSQISLPGRYLVFVPGGSMTGISRKLPDNERSRLKKIMRELIPEDAGVIVRTAAEGASEEELTRDVERLRAQWDKITKAQKSKSAPAALSQEPDLAIKVVRDVFNEDFSSLIIEGEKAYKNVHEYVAGVAPDLLERVTKHVGDKDVFAKHRIDEQLLKAMDRKVYLPSGGSLVFDRTEAMTVVDVNTGKFTGSGGTLEETVTKNNLEAAEEIVRQLRLRDIGGIIVIDFIDMVLESNRDLVLRRLVECLGRDRTKHQVAEVTSLGLVQMTRKRVGQGLVDTFSATCEHCSGRGLIVDLDGNATGHSHSHDGNGGAEARGKGSGEDSSRSGKRRGRKSRSGGQDEKKDTADSAETGGEVHHLEEDEDSRALARATIASIAAASNSHSHPEVTVDGQVIAMDDTRTPGSETAEQQPAAQAEQVAEAEQTVQAAGSGGAIPAPVEQDQQPDETKQPQTASSEQPDDPSSPA